jgi:hypothetical protein
LEVKPAVEVAFAVQAEVVLSAEGVGEGMVAVFGEIGVLFEGMGVVSFVV